MSYFDKLSMAGNDIIDYINNHSGDSALKCITILIPREDTFNLDNTDVDLLTNNKKCFDSLINQTGPVLIFMRRLGDTKPYAQYVMRMRHLDDIGEGTSFFAFGYYVPYTSKDNYGLLAYSDEMYKLISDGSIERINLLGEPYGSSVIFPPEPIELTKEALVGTYNHRDESVPSMLGLTYLPEIYMDKGNLMMRYPLGSAIEDVNCRTQVVLNIEDKTLTIEGGYTHPTIGPIDKAITMAIDTTSGNIQMTAMDSVITLNDWTTLTNYVMEKNS